MPRGRKGKTDLYEALQELVERTEGGCWLWQGPLTEDDKPVLYVGRETIDVRRWMYRLSLRSLTTSETLKPACWRERCVAPHHQLVRRKRQRADDEWEPRVGGIPVYQGEAGACPKCGNVLADRDEDGDLKCLVCAFVLTRVPPDVLDEVTGKLLTRKEEGVILDTT